MKGILKIIALTMGLILLFSGALLAGTYALAESPAGEKDHEVDRFTDASLFLSAAESGPTPQSDLQEKFDVYSFTETIEGETREDGTPKTRLIFFSEEQVEDLYGRRQTGELFTLSYDEILYIISDSIRQYQSHDQIILREANRLGLTEAGPQSSSSYIIDCIRGAYPGLSYTGEQYWYFRMMDDLFRIITYRITMLDSSFCRYDRWVGEDGSIYIAIEGEEEAVPANAFSRDSDQVVKASDLHLFASHEETVYLKSFADADSPLALKQTAALDYGLYDTACHRALSSVVSSVYAPEWTSGTVSGAPLLIFSFMKGTHRIDRIETATLTPSPDMPVPETLFPTPELKQLEPVYDPTAEIAKTHERSESELLALEQMPGYDVSIPTQAYPLKYYKNGVDGDGNGLKPGMTFAEMVEEFGLPYNGFTSGFFTLIYYTDTEKPIVVYMTTRQSALPEFEYEIMDISWPEG